MANTPPVSSLPPPVPPKIPMNAPQRNNSNSAFKAVKAGKPSPLSMITRDNLARWREMQTDPTFPVPETPEDLLYDPTRDTRFYEFYDDVLPSSSTGRESPPKEERTEKGKDKK